jgi:uncharacterized protein YndB with AHSA1/START domain
LFTTPSSPSARTATHPIADSQRGATRRPSASGFAEDEGWRIEEYGLDFRVGGREHGRFRRGNGPETRNETVYLDIVPDRRIVMAYTMALDGKSISASLGTVEFEARRRRHAAHLHRAGRVLRRR